MLLALVSAAAMAQGGPSYLVWTSRIEEIDASERRLVLETAWVDSDGTVVARRPAVVVAAGGGMWEHRNALSLGTRYDCECLAEGGDAAACRHPDETTDGVVVDLVSGAQVPVATTDPALRVRASDRFSEPYASVGPYLFVRSVDRRSECAATRFFVHAEAVVLDLGAGGARMDVFTDSERAALPPPVDPQPRSPVLLTSSDPGTEVVQVTPRWGADGALRVDYDRTTPTCKSCVAPDLTSYQTLASSTGYVPVRLVPYAITPATVATYLASHPDDGMRGWSEVPAGAHATWLDLFRRPVP